MPIKIGPRTFEVPPPPGMESFALQERIFPILSRVANVVLHAIAANGKMITKLADLFEEDVLKSLPGIVMKIGPVFSEMPRGELEWLTRTLLKNATFDGKPLFGDPLGDAFGPIFQGKNLEIWKLLWYAAKVWYPDFFALADAFGAKAKASAASPSATSTTSDPLTPASA